MEILDHLYRWNFPPFPTTVYKFDHGLSHLLHEELHWLDVPERIHYRLGVTVHAVCSTRPQSTWSTAVHQSQTFPCSRHHLRPVTRHHLTVPRYRLITFGRWAFSVAGPTVWNSLPDSLRDPALTSNSFTQSLFCRTHSAVEMLHDCALYKSIIDIDIEIYSWHAASCSLGLHFPVIAHLCCTCWGVS